MSADPKADASGPSGDQAAGRTSDQPDHAVDPVDQSGQPDQPDPRGSGPRPRVRALAWYLVPLAIYVASRLAQYALLAWLLPAGSEGGVRERLLAWDTQWFVDVARDGYPAGYTYDDAGGLSANGLAFFPAFPALIRLVHAITGQDYETAALIAGTLSGGAATIAVYALGAQLYRRRVGLIFATLFCAQPMSLVFSMGYSEGLFVALVAVALLAAYRDAWLTAGLAGLAAGLSRPTGAAVAVALVLAALPRLISWWWGADQPAESGRRPARWRVLAGTFLALVSVPGYLTWVGIRAGSASAWFDIQTAGWGTTFDWGATVGRFMVDTLRSSDGWVALSVVWILIAAVLLSVIALKQRVWMPLAGYGLLSLALVLGQAGFYHSKVRLLVPVLLILVPPAVALARAKTSTIVLVLTGYAAVGLWYGAHMITVWRFAI